MHYFFLIKVSASATCDTQADFSSEDDSWLFAVPDNTTLQVDLNLFSFNLLYNCPVDIFESASILKYVTGFV